MSESVRKEAPEICFKCDTKEFIKENVIVDPCDDGTLMEVTYDLYCKNCGQYLGSFEWGMWDYSLLEHGLTPRTRYQQYVDELNL